MDFRALLSLRNLVTLGGIQNILGGDKIQLHPSLLHSAPRVGATHSARSHCGLGACTPPLWFHSRIRAYSV